MKVLVCGSREWADREAVEARIAALPANTIVIEGGARGADVMAGAAARRRGLETAEMRALWGYHGWEAGRRRNCAMLDLGPDLVVAFHRNGSRGTQHTIDEARRRGIPVEVVTA